MELDLREFLRERLTLYEAIDFYRYRYFNSEKFHETCYFDHPEVILYILKVLPIDIKKVIIEKIEEWEKMVYEICNIVLEEYLENDLINYLSYVEPLNSHPEDYHLWEYTSFDTEDYDSETSQSISL